MACRECRLVRLLSHAEPSYKELYSESYYTNNYVPIKALQEETALGILTHVEKLVSPGKLVDYGCGLGVLLAVAHQRGWSCMGLDSSAAALRMARTELPDEVELELLQDGGPNYFAEESVQCVTFLDSLAHIPAMPEVLEQVIRSLRPDGIVVIRTPNYPRRLQVLGWASGHLSSTAGDLVFHVPQQLWHFTQQPLTTLLERLGLTIISISLMEDHGSKRSVPRPNPSPKSVMRWLLAMTRRRLVPKGSMLTIAQRK